MDKMVGGASRKESAQYRKDRLIFERAGPALRGYRKKHPGRHRYYRFATKRKQDQRGKSKPEKLMNYTHGNDHTTRFFLI